MISSSMVQKTVLKVNFSCPKCKKKLLKSVTGLQGIDKIELDAAKDTLAVTGSADPYEVILRARKTIKYVEVISIGPPPKPEAASTTGGGGGGQKKDEEVMKKPAHDQEMSLYNIHRPRPCHDCERMIVPGFVGQSNIDPPTMPCSIL